MRRFILTGAPGSGKTSILRALQAKGYAAVDEAATDVIAIEQARGVDEPWLDPMFIDKIIDMQRTRQVAEPPAVASGPVAAGRDVAFYDRSPVCTLALARFIGHPTSAALAAELTRIIEQGIYERPVFFIRPLGFVEPTEARRISYEDSLKFERLHEEEYARLGFQIVDIPPASAAARAAAIEALVAS